ncbi:MAG: DUF3240 family protein [Sideroxydans sp.]|nr:DUF3240 family protein [Sideroxydans sp.]MDD5470813.1 DUF3240 family protein [Sideroxydans sp.]
MKEMNCCLTLVCHKSLEERLVDQLLSHPDWVRGFSIKHIEGGSQKEKLPSMLEQVRGRSQRVQIDSVMNLEDAKQLIEHLKQTEPNNEIAYWLVPVLEFGRLA